MTAYLKVLIITPIHRRKNLKPSDGIISQSAALAELD
jgi:hypothetical protein